jgi:hypothetical protein
MNGNGNSIRERKDSKNAHLDYEKGIENSMREGNFIIRSYNI